MMKINVPALEYDAMMVLQKHCEKHEKCADCCFCIRKENEFCSRCVLGEMPRDYADFKEFQREAKQ